LAWFGVSFIWPDWKFRRLPRTIQRSLQAQCNYLKDVVRQYHEGRDHGLNYRVARRAAHNTDAEVASLISTLATEPDFDPIKKLWLLSFLFESYFPKLYCCVGAHREQIQDQDILKLLDQALDDIQGALLRDEVPDLTHKICCKPFASASNKIVRRSKSLIILQQFH
jgi:uncharacterized membrane protein YccC